MEVTFAEKRMARACASERSMLREYGKQRADLLAKRLEAFYVSETLADLRTLPGRTHELTGDWAGHLAVSLDGPYRLVFAADPAVYRPDGGLDWDAVKAVVVVGIENYHDA